MQPNDQPPPYSPPGQPYPHPGGPPPGHTTTTFVSAQPVIVAQPTTTMIISSGVLVDSNPTLMVCPSCNTQIVTRVELTPSCRTHVIAALFCLFIFWPCACLPYCIGSCNNADHYCPNCSAYIGAYRF